MDVRRTLVLAVLGLPLFALANAPVGSCDYTSQDPKDKGLTFCAHVADVAQCNAEATKKSSEAWVKAHPPKFTPGVRCDAKGPSKKAKASAKATATVKSEKGTTTPTNAAKSAAASPAP